MRRNRNFINDVHDDRVNSSLSITNQPYNRSYIHAHNITTLNETKREPIKYSIGNDYLYTNRMYGLKKRYMNGEITKEQYKEMTQLVKQKARSINVRKIVSDRYDLEPYRNKVFKR